MSENFWPDSHEQKRSSLAGDIGWAIEFLRLGRWPIGISVVLVTALGILYLHVAKPLYSIETTISPASQSNAAPSGGSASLLASLAGIDVSGGAGEALTNFLMVLEVAHSAQAAQILARDPEFMHEVFAGQWDAAEGRWLQPSGWRTAVASALRRIFNRPPAGPPDANVLRQYLSSAISVNLVERTPFRQLQFHFADRALGMQILGKVLRVADDIVRKMALDRVSQQVADLQSEIQRTTLIATQDSLRIILLEQLRTLILTRSGEHFAYRSVDDVNASTNPSSPRILLTLALSALLGFACGAGWQAVRLRRQTQKLEARGADLSRVESVAQITGN